MYDSDCLTIGGLYQGDGTVCADGCGFGDFDRDAAVDLRDLAVFQRCFGADDIDSTDSCWLADINSCQDINLLDYDAFRRAVTGP